MNLYKTNGSHPYKSLHFLWEEHVKALLVFAIFSVFWSWPLVLNFSSKIPRNNPDALLHLWGFWHVKEWFLGRQPLFSTPYLYYPHGASWLANATGPIIGFFALPFWKWSPEAAYNGAMLISLILTGYCTYLLARSLGMARSVSIFSGICIVAVPLSFTGLNDQPERLFLGGMALTLLAFRNALNSKRSLWWAPVAGLSLLLVLLTSGLQLVYIGLALALMFLLTWIIGGPSNWGNLLKRGAAVFLCCLLLCGPLVYQLAVFGRDPSIQSSLAWSSVYYQPDLVQFFLPLHNSVLFGSSVTRLLSPYPMIFTGETLVALTWVSILLCLPAWKWGSWSARTWILLTAFFVLISLGPSLKILGHSYLAGKMPYSLLTSFPVMNSVRTPGRFMLIGFMCLAIASGYGLTWLIQLWPKKEMWIVLATTGLFLVFNYIGPVHTTSLQLVPAFYKNLASDQEIYGVFDLPASDLSLGVGGNNYGLFSSIYQRYQMVHRKAIVAGYLSRNYLIHPVFPQLLSGYSAWNEDFRVNGQPSSAYTNAQIELAQNNFRYIVYHKALKDDAKQLLAKDYLRAAFSDEKPLYEDNETVVYHVAPVTDTQKLKTSISLVGNWRGREPGFRWATSPALLYVESPRTQSAVLQITPAMIHDPNSKKGMGCCGVLKVEYGDQFSTYVQIQSGKQASVPIDLLPGGKLLKLTLQAGNFKPSDYGLGDTSVLSFAIQSINLQAPVP